MSAILAEGNDLFTDGDFRGALQKFEEASSGQDDVILRTLALAKVALARSKLLQKSAENGDGNEAELFANALTSATSALLGLDFNTLEKHEQYHALRRASIATANLALEANRYSDARQLAKKCGNEGQAEEILARCEAVLGADTEEKNVVSQQQQQQPEKEAVPAKAAPALRHEWYQTATHVFVNIFRKGMKQEEVVVEIAEKSLDITVQLEEGREAQFNWELCQPVVVAESKFVLMSTKMEVKLAKQNTGVQWPSLEASDAVITPAAAAATAPITGVSDLRPPVKRKNWDQIAAESGADEEEKLEGDQALNKVFRDIFARGTDEQKKAMAKSFTESGGTVLSTNWDEVGTKKVEGSPPTGQEMHKIDPYTGQ